MHYLPFWPSNPVLGSTFSFWYKDSKEMWSFLKFILVFMNCFKKQFMAEMISLEDPQGWTN